MTADPETPDAPLALRARWIFPVGETPIEEGVIQIESGRIVRLSNDTVAEAIDLGRAAIIPGLVNAHTHLEFSRLTEPLPQTASFADWVRSVVRSRSEQAGLATDAIRRGIGECIANGTAAVGEIATSPESADVLDAAAIRSTVFWEVLGLDDSAVVRQQQAVMDHLGGGEAGIPSTCRRGLSPHAPYSVHPDLLEWTLEVARQRQATVAMHLAETREELELLHHGSGPLVEMLSDFGLWQDGILHIPTTILAYLESLARLERVLIIHGNYLSREDIEYIATRPQFSVVYCPRTHAYFGHERHPWRELLERGVNVCLGTDSRASSPDLSLWNEALFLRRTASDVPGETLLQMATRNGRQALGEATDCSGLGLGASANLSVVTLPAEASGTDDPYDRLLNPASRASGLMCEGRWVVRPPVIGHPESMRPTRRT